jgi:hypothetical protein
LTVTETPSSEHRHGQRVFADDFLSELHARFDSRQDYHAGPAYRVAVWESTAPIRVEIEQWVAELPEPARRKIVPRLRSDENLDSTYHELAVGMLLRGAGLEVEYEATTAGVTPDWTATAPDGRRLMFVEVLTANPPDKQVSRQRAVWELWARLKHLQFGVALGIRMPDACPTPHSGQIKHIVTEAERWLATDPQQGVSLDVEGLRLSVIVWNRAWPHVVPNGPATALIVDYDGLSRRIAKKVDGYGALVRQTNIPLVAAVATEFTMGHDISTVDGVLFGRPENELQFDRVTGDILGTTYLGRKDALFDRAPLLSAVLYVARQNAGWAAWLFRNPSAAIPLPPELAERLEQALTRLRDPAASGG